MRLQILVVVLLCLKAAPALAITAATAVTMDLERQPIRIQRLERGALSFFDSSRRLRVEPIDQFVQLLIQAPAGDADGTIEDPQPQAPSAAVVLIDGQRLVGSIEGTADDGQTLRFEHEALGRIEVSLEAVHAFWPPGSTPFELDSAGAIGKDQVVLVNEDRLEGFVTGVDVDQVRVLVDGGATIDVPMDRITMVRLANPIEALAGAADRVDLADGSRVHASQLTIAKDRLELAAALRGGSEAGTVSMDLIQVKRIELARSGWRLVDLVQLPRRVAGGGAVFGAPMPPRVWRNDLWLHAPIRMQIDMPPGAHRFAAEAQIDAGGGASGWADFVVTISVDGRPQGSWHLHANDPAAPINVPVSGDVMTIELDPGVNGPVMDRLWLRHAMVLAQGGG